MALVKCPDCGREVSDRAPSCPQCGRSFAATTVEQTSKPIKSAKLGGCLGSALGFFVMLAGMASGIDGTGTATFGLLLFLAGSFAYVGATILKWWRHD